MDVSFNIFLRLDAKELDILLGEIVLLSSRTELYQSFLINRLQVGSVLACFLLYSLIKLGSKVF